MEDKLKINSIFLPKYKIELDERSYNDNIIRFVFPTKKMFYSKKYNHKKKSFDYVLFKPKQDITFKSGNFYFVKGGNGSGKSTFFNILMLLKLNRLSNLPITFFFNEKQSLNLNSFNSFFKRMKHPVNLRKLRSSISKIYQNSYYEDVLTIDENFTFFENKIDDNEEMYYRLKSDKPQSITTFRDIKKNYINKSSGGEKFMIYFNLFFDKKKSLFIIDEMYNELDMFNQCLVNKKIHSLNDRDRDDIVIINEHQLEMDKLKKKYGTKIKMYSIKSEFYSANSKSNNSDKDGQLLIYEINRVEKDILEEILPLPKEGLWQK